jgi:predicted hydrocarbon binding protein
MTAVTQTAGNIHASGTAERVKSKTYALQRRIRVLEANLAKALLVSETLWEFIKENHNLTDEQLRKKVNEVDLRDGMLDGKNQRKAVECPNCRHMVSPRHPACVYCGQVIDDSIFTMD